MAPGVEARDRIDAIAETGRVVLRRLGDESDGGLALVSQPSRFKRAYAAEGEESVPYLRPYDVLEYLPVSADLLSTARSESLDDYRLKAGSILQTCSGRNLGPLTVADEYLEDFVLSHDMIRVDVIDNELRDYVYAFLSTSIGSSVLRQRMSGSVVDHLTTKDVGDLLIPVIEGEPFKESVSSARRSIDFVQQARLELSRVTAALRRRYPQKARERPKRAGWSVTSTALARGGRLDAHYHDTAVAEARDQMEHAGGTRLGEVAEAMLPARYKRYYVEPGFGRPIMSGRQLLQVNPVNLRYISDRSFKNPSSMLLDPGMVVFGAVGRWEGRLGEPALISADRAGWMASNDVMRLTPRDGATDSGWLWLAMTLPQVRQQVAALPYGSVIDHTGPFDVENKIWLPPIDAELGRRARVAWEQFDAARAARSKAVETIESTIWGE